MSQVWSVALAEIFLQNSNARTTSNYTHEHRSPSPDAEAMLPEPDERPPNAAVPPNTAVPLPRGCRVGDDPVILAQTTRMSSLLVLSHTSGHTGQRRLRNKPHMWRDTVTLALPSQMEWKKYSSMAKFQSEWRSQRCHSTTGDQQNENTEPRGWHFLSFLPGRLLLSKWLSL